MGKPQVAQVVEGHLPRAVTTRVHWVAEEQVEGIVEVSVEGLAPVRPA